MSLVESPVAGIVRFLVVDDSRAIQSIIRRTLEAADFPGVEIKVASDVDAAFNELQTFSPDLVITDWHMPKMTGLDFLKRLRMEGRQHLRVGFVTTESNPTKLEEARRHGAVFVVNKPFNDQQFIEQVKSALTRSTEIQANYEISSEGFIIQPDHCRAILAAVLPNARLTLEPALPVLPTFLTPHNLLGLYGFGGQSQPVGALAVLDMKAVAILWGEAHGASLEDVTSLSSQQDVDDDLLNVPRQFMEQAGPKILITPDKAPLALTRSSIVAQGFRRLHELMGNRDGRADFTLKSEAYGKGHMTFLMV